MQIKAEKEYQAYLEAVRYAKKWIQMRKLHVMFKRIQTRIDDLLVKKRRNILILRSRLFIYMGVKKMFR